MERKKELLWRAYLVMIGFVAVTLVILYKVFYISVIDAEKWKQKGEVNVKWRTVDADRGNIYAEEENLLATSIQFFEVRMDMASIRKDVFNENVDSLAAGLSAFDPNFIEPRSKAEWKSALKSARAKGKKYFFIAKGLDIEAFNKLRKLPLFKLGKANSGMIVNRYGKRIKPYQDLASRTIGLDRENADKIGLEGYFDKYLKGETDERLMKRLGTGEDKDIWVPVFDPSENEIKRGDDVYTTINIDMQDIVHQELMKAVTKHKAESGVAILMETKTGAIKAISNLTKAPEDSTYHEMYNLAASRLSEPGSTIKLATMLALMEDGVDNPDTVVQLNYGQRQFSDRIMHDSEEHGLASATMQHCFEISSNVGCAVLANNRYNTDTGRKLWIKRLKQFGLHKPTGIDLIGEAKPELKDPVIDKTKWYGTTIPWMAHGYEMMMTPLQILNFYNSVANDGKMMRPYLVSEIRKGEETKKKFSPVVVNAQIAKPENIAKAKRMMEGVIYNAKGTGKSLRSESVTLAGKTGTAKTNYANLGASPKYNGSFCGYFPTNDPMYTMIVIIYEPSNGVFYGGYTAGPVFKAVAEKVYALKTKQVRTLDDSVAIASNLPGAAYGYGKDFDQIFSFLDFKTSGKSSSSWVITSMKSGEMEIANRKMKKDAIPDVRGMGARDAVYALERAGLKVKVKGAGRVRSQSIPSGSAANGRTITIELN
jgi:cell division protein FtsI (penicillin-binding protein 3)